MAGIFDMFSGSPQQQGLLAAAAQILQASGPSLRPQSLGQIIGGGIGAFQDVSAHARQQEQMGQLRGLQIKEAESQLLEQQRQRDLLRQAEEAARSSYRTPGQQAAALPGGPTPENAEQIPGMKGGFDSDEFLGKMWSINPMEAMKLAQQFKKSAPELQSVDIATQNGVPVRVLRFKDGTEKISQFDPQSEMVEMNLGGVTKWVDKNRVQNGQTFQRTASPDTLANNSVSIRGQNMTDARARQALALQQQTGKAPTEFQGKSAAFGLRAAEADKTISSLTGQYSPAAINAKNTVGKTWLVGGALEAGANLALSESDQRAEQAQRDFINAVLRQESGAAIGADEFNNARRQYFPQPGDSQAVITQKARNRQLAVQGLQSNAGRAAMTAPPAAGGGVTFLGFE